MKIHPSIANLLSYLEYEPMPEELHPCCKPFYDLAVEIVERQSGPETAVGLRKLLDARDAILRGFINEQITMIERPHGIGDN